MAKVVSFAEESCWDGEKFRSVRRQIVFVVAAFNIPGAAENSIRREITADFGLWYDQDDEWLINLLKREIPGPRWDWYVYHKKIDHTAIMIHNPDDGKIVGQIYPRGRTRQKLSGENGGANVVNIVKGGEYRAKRIKRDRERAEKRRGGENQPEGS